MITQFYEHSVLAQQAYNTGYFVGQIFGVIFMIVLALAILKKIMS